MAHIDYSQQLMKYAAMSDTVLIREAQYHAAYDHIRNLSKVMLERGSYKNFPKSLFSDTLVDTMDSYSAVVAKLKAKNKELHPYAFVTINLPDTDIELSTYLDVPKIFDRVWVSKIWYSYEWCNSKGRYTHPHVHVLIELRRLKKKRSEIVRETLSRVNEQLDEEFPDTIIDVKFGSDYKRFLNYIKGLSKKKQTHQVDADREYRSLWGLQDWYQYKRT